MRIGISVHSVMMPAMHTSMKEFHSVGLNLWSSEPKVLILAMILSTKSFLPLYFYFSSGVSWIFTISFYKML